MLWTCSAYLLFFFLIRYIVQYTHIVLALDDGNKHISYSIAFSLMSLREVNRGTLAVYYLYSFVQHGSLATAGGVYELFIPMYNRKVFIFRCGSVLLKVSKNARNINRTA